MASGYVLDAAGLPMPPLLLGVLGAVTGIAAFRAYRETDAADAPGSLVLFLLVTACACAYLLWLASPSFLPVTTGPDVVHHLQLIHLIQRTHRLAHDPALSPYLLEMMNYTPGAHILAATTGTWLRIDAVRVVQPIAALFIALKIGLVYLLALRAGDGLRGARVSALAAPLLAFVPAVYTLGSSYEFFFFAQVISE